MNSSPATNAQLTAEAAEWLARLIDEEPDPTDPNSDRSVLQADFYAWLIRSRRHLETFLETVASFEKLGDIDLNQKIELRKLLENPPANVVHLFDAQQEETPIDHLPLAAPKQIPRRRMMLFAALTMATALAGLGALSWVQSRLPNYATHVGEQRSWRLDDGSVVYLNTDSHLEVHFSQTARRVQLLQGEALFVVEHDTARPFIVSTGTANIRAVGTQFNVYRRTNGTEVAVVEGVVQVTPDNTLEDEAGSASARATSLAHPDSWPSTKSAPPARESFPAGAVGAASRMAQAGIQLLAAGEEASVSSGQVIKQAAADVTNAVAWRQRQLVFRRATLAEVAAEFNRYNKAQIRIEGDEVRGRHLSGTFSADHPQALILYLSKDNSLSVRTEGDDWIVQPR